MGEPATVYDVGMHIGEDTEFYLKKGFRVVAIDANPELCARVGQRLRPYIDSGRLTIVNKAISTVASTVTFYRNLKTDEWGTIDPLWADRNRRMGAPSEEFVVEAVPLSELIAVHGEPYFVKIDIEGMDQIALRSLGGTAARPKYISVESDKVSFAKLREEFDTFQSMGYDRFKVVPMHLVPQQRPPRPPREGDYVDHSFPWGASGLFGEEAPGEWITAAEAIEAYKPIFLRYHLFGDDPLVRNRVVRKIARHLVTVGWYDTHAKLAGA